MVKFCFLDISIGGELVGRIVVELFGSVPEASENFMALCTGSRDPLLPHGYKGSRFRRIVKGFLVQGGGIFRETGGAEFPENSKQTSSLYRLSTPRFKCENFDYKHSEPGMLSLSNAAQFFITTAKAPILDNKHVVFGRVIRGFGVLCAIESVQVGDDYCPTTDVVIVNCGELIHGPPAMTHDPFPNLPMNLTQMICAVEDIKFIGDSYMKNSEYEMASNEYTTALRYHDYCSDIYRQGMSEDQHKLLRTLKCQIFMKLSKSRWMLRDFAMALSNADAAILADKDCDLAYCCKGQAYLQKHGGVVTGLDKALEWFDIALKLGPDNDGSVKKYHAFAKSLIADRQVHQEKSDERIFQ
ncbi:hypothetical protein C2S51_037809 [Perilla frutescens var. frutescens]|nr:hypothetical protein C2S51_037809 [Perilla frutescens var. frutescens]